MRIAIALAFTAAACGEKAAETTCTCTPGNTAHVKRARDDAPMTGEALVAALRRHAQDVALGKNPRDIKVRDDELRFQIIDFCQPCAHWVHDRMTMEEMFPLDRLDDAVRAVCMGLVLRDGTTIYGSSRPAACR